MKHQQTFNLQNMQTYFRHYIPCPDHPKEPITNFCTERICLRFLCPECVEIHSQHHANHPIQSIKTCVKKTSNMISETVSELEGQTNSHHFLKSKSSEQYAKELLGELDTVKRSLLAEIHSYFKEKQSEIRKEAQKGNLFRVRMDSLRSEILQAITQLKMLNGNLFNTNETVRAIKKANSIDYRNMLNHFKKQIHALQNQLDINVKVELDPHKRQVFRNSLNNLVGVKSTSTGKMHSHSRTFVGNNISNIRANLGGTGQQFSRYNQMPASEEEVSYQNQEEYILNPPPLSADRLLNQASLRISTPNFFSTGQPFLHFFQVTKSSLHLTRISQTLQTQKTKWQVIPLDIDFKIPSFHRTLATEDGNIYLFGGTFIENMKKSDRIYQYDPINRKLNHVASLQVGRSSHSVVCHRGLIYVVGGMTENDQILKKFQVFNPASKTVKQLSSCKFATTNSTLCYIGENLIKMGGVFSSGQNNDHIQIYNITANFWGQVDPTIQNVKGQFGLISCSGWSILNDQQIFIFGGYNQQSQNQNSKMSFILECSSSNDYTIKYVNAKNLPIAQGFWNQQAIVHKGSIYCLQNVDGEEDNDCLEDYRNLLVFNGKYWTACHSE